MKKILSIMLALGLVLGMVLATVPAAAQPPGDWTIVTVGVAPVCQNVLATYTIGITTTETLDPSHEVWVEFPEGTGFPAVWGAGHITFAGQPVNPLEITREGNVVKFVVPELVSPPGAYNIVFAPAIVAPATTPSGIINPPAGKYHLFVKTSRVAMSTWVKSGYTAGPPAGYVPYTIVPTRSTYKFELDFGVTYPGIGKDVIPPFKACGQDAPYRFSHPVNNVTYPGGFTGFNVTLQNNAPAGCAGYDPVRINFELKSAPATGVATLVLFDGATWYTFPLSTPGHATLPKGFWGPALGFPLPAVYDVDVPALVHFSVPGDYEIYFELKYLGLADPCDPIPADVITSRTVTATVLQEKDTFGRTPLNPKWNFFSTPVRLNNNAIDDVFGPVMHNLKAVWHWDNVQGKWFYYSPNSGLPTGSQPLSTIEDGKGYMVRMKTTYEGWAPAVNPNLWLFGEAQAYAPNPPFTYNVAKGWTMMGVSSILPGGVVPATYLAPAAFLAPVKTLSGNAYIDLAGNMMPGFGYWVYFTAPGQVVP